MQRFKLLVLVLGFGLHLGLLHASEGGEPEQAPDEAIKFGQDFSVDIEQRDLNAIHSCVTAKYKFARPFDGETDLFRLVCPGHGSRRFLTSFIWQDDEAGQPEIVVDAIQPLTPEEEETYWKKTARGQMIHRVRWPKGSSRLIEGDRVEGIWIEGWKLNEIVGTNGLKVTEIDGIVSHIQYPVRSGEDEFSESMRFGDSTYNLTVKKSGGGFYLVKLVRGQVPYLHRPVNLALSCRMSMR